MPAISFTTGLGTFIFAIAVLNTFTTHLFNRQALKAGPHAGFWRLLSEVEVVFGFWALVYLLCMALLNGPGSVETYLASLSFAEPAFVFAIMIVASSKPVLSLATRIILNIATRLPMPMGMATFITALTLGPLFGSFITEPAAMTLTALILYIVFFRQPVSETLKYALIGTLFVNVSIGGVLTHFAAPPVLMSAPKWGWGLWHMFAHFGWKASLAVAANAMIATLVFSRQLTALKVVIPESLSEDIPHWITACHLATLVLLVVFVHQPLVFLTVFMGFLGFVTAYKEHQSDLLMRNSLLVGVFLAGLVILGTPQQWWVSALLARMDSLVLYFGATALTAVTDNAALAYLGSLAPDLSDASKYALLAGSVTGGGLTVIANAPNPAGFSILKSGFRGGEINPLWLFVAGVIPTLVAIAVFLLLPA